MATSRFFRLQDPYQFETAIRGGEFEILAKSKGRFDVELSRVDLDRLWMQGSRSDAAYVMKSSTTPDRIPVFFLNDALQAPVGHNGIEISAHDLVVYKLAVDCHVWTQGTSSLANMSLNAEDFAAASKAILGCELDIPRETHVIRPAPALLARLQALHKAAYQLSRDMPDALARPATAKSLEHELVHTMVACLAGHPQIGSRPHTDAHFKVIARFEDFLAEKQQEPVYLAEICAAIGISERSLRSCCQKHLSMGPIHYLWLRRMHMARRSLLAADPQSETVTEIATANGFWELGRFSVEYRRLFGESPSATLKCGSLGQGVAH
jgi:AraC-like DNA-binding protein